MQPPTKRWQIAPKISAEAARALDAYHPVLAQLLYNRQVETAEAAQIFLAAQPPPGSDPLGLHGMAAAVDRILWALDHHEPIVIYGDYDVDGVTATALLQQTFQALGAEARGYIPNRFDEGYGLNNEALDALAAEGARLVITVDCGIRSPEEIEHARSLGLDVIVTDHHHLGPEIPRAWAVINPKQPACSYPEKDLAGVGLAYKLACALLAARDLRPASRVLLDLVALGTVADLAPLAGENRALVRAGLEVIRRGQRQGLRSLIGVSGLNPLRINAGHIGFMLGPRLNAAGRLDSALAALRLLTAASPDETGPLAQQLDNQNRARQELTQQIQEQAEAIAFSAGPTASLLFAAHPDFNAGVVGLAASRLVDRFYRPAIVAQRGETFTRGSCRSIPEFHITAALDACADLLEHHGGHAYAAGFTVRNENLPALVERLQKIASDQLGAMDLRPTLHADLELPLSSLKPEIINYLEWLQPTGQNNPQAVFVSRDLKVVSRRTVGKNQDHLRLTVTDGRITYDGIAFRLGHLAAALPPRIDLLYNFETNEFNGATTLQLNVRDLKPAG